MTGSDSPEALEWAVDLGPALRSRRLVVIVVTLLVVSVGLFAFRSWVLALVGAAAVLASTAEVFLPLKYRLDAEGAHRRVGLSSSVIGWPDVKRVVEDEAGIHLSPFDSPSRLDSFRGVYLRTPSNREAVLGKITQLREENGRNLD